MSTKHEPTSKKVKVYTQSFKEGRFKVAELKSWLKRDDCDREVITPNDAKLLLKIITHRC